MCTYTCPDILICVWSHASIISFSVEFRLEVIITSKCCSTLSRQSEQESDESEVNGRPLFLSNGCAFEISYSSWTKSACADKFCAERSIVRKDPSTHYCKASVNFRANKPKHWMFDQLNREQTTKRSEHRTQINDALTTNPQTNFVLCFPTITWIKYYQKRKGQTNGSA